MTVSSGHTSLSNGYYLYKQIPIHIQCMQKDILWLAYFNFFLVPWEVSGRPDLPLLYTRITGRIFHHWPDRRNYDDDDMIYLLTAIGLPPGGSSTVHIYTQAIHRTTQSTQTIHRKTQVWVDVAADRGFLWDRLPCSVSDIRNNLYNQLGMRDARFSEVDRSKWLRNGFCFGDSVTPRNINTHDILTPAKWGGLWIYTDGSHWFSNNVILPHLYSC